MRRDARVARAEDGVDAVETVDRRTPASGIALIARGGGVVEIVATRPLKQIAARGSHIAQLLPRRLRGSRSTVRVALFDQRMVGEVGVWYERADAQSAASVSSTSLSASREMSTSFAGTFDILFHEVDEIGAACDKLRARISSDPANGVGDVGCADIFEIDHDCAMAC